MSKTFGIKALAMVASLGMTAVLVGGCNPADEHRQAYHPDHARGQAED